MFFTKKRERTTRKQRSGPTRAAPLTRGLLCLVFSMGMLSLQQETRGKGHRTPPDTLDERRTKSKLAEAEADVQCQKLKDVEKRAEILAKAEASYNETHNTPAGGPRTPRIGIMLNGTDGWKQRIAELTARLEQSVKDKDADDALKGIDKARTKRAQYSEQRKQEKRAARWYKRWALRCKTLREAIKGELDQAAADNMKERMSTDVHGRPTHQGQ